MIDLNDKLQLAADMLGLWDKTVNDLTDHCRDKLGNVSHVQVNDRLQSLLDRGLIEERGTGYKLTGKGKLYLALSDPQKHAIKIRLETVDNPQKPMARKNSARLYLRGMAWLVTSDQDEKTNFQGLRSIVE